MFGIKVRREHRVLKMEGVKSEMRHFACQDFYLLLVAYMIFFVVKNCKHNGLKHEISFADEIIQQKSLNILLRCKTQNNL